MIADEDVHRHALEKIEQADALLLGRVTYQMMEAGWSVWTLWRETLMATGDATAIRITVAP
jgi:hypothetical protein